MARIDFTYRGFHFRGGDTPSFGLDRDVALYRVWFGMVWHMVWYGMASLTGCVFELEAFKRVCVKAAGSMKLE